MRLQRPSRPGEKVGKGLPQVLILNVQPGERPISHAPESPELSRRCHGRVGTDHAYQPVAWKVVALDQGIVLKRIEGPGDEVSQPDLLADHDPQVLDGELVKGLGPEPVASRHEV